MPQKKQLNKKNRPSVKKNPFSSLQEGHVIVPAFISGDVQYYMMKDAMNSYCLRAMDGLSIYESVNRRCSPEFLREFSKSMDAVLSNPKVIKLQEVVLLNNLLKERLDFAIPPEELIWQLASVTYFDENESPYKYDPEYGKEKIERWKKENEAKDFFLTSPIKTLIPLPDLSQNDLDTCLKIINKVDKKHLEILSALQLSKAQKAATT